MRVNSIGIFTNPNNDGALDAAEAVLLAASVRGISCFIDKSLLDIEQFQGLDTTETNTPDLMVAMGGDGTILRACMSLSESVQSSPSRSSRRRPAYAETRSCH